ncbi:hippurate hydrolase [Luminiphilus syltensis NOR5-1B]|uniref:Hippurate hydrolase n=1 Tax=Luminiphilus syltensis NOR5-1B TaxID=565045 RepID=B8KVW8_9GAMM|nr:N(2)-acetyl-L-2,4-diaminobutanoate deacetylase DoeB2 [Luminiphilus syltensis]EED36317.1 hippurate hydrolase [Luminiphilus syltensis NOR5-1B]
MPNDWQNTIALATNVRHELHQQPELTWKEEHTASVIRHHLTELGIAWAPCAGTGTVATVNPNGATPGIALRGDIDALPITENSGVDWSSQSTGCMHACGHDGHTATLLAAAAWLKLHEASLESRITLLFQPAEEGGHGARAMIEEGALEGVEKIYGWHNWPGLPLGQLACPDGIVMAGNGTFEIDLTSSGGHASQPDITGDTILAASAVTMALQQIVSRRLPPQTAAVVSVTSIDGASAPTVIPQSVTVSGSIRVPNSEVRNRVNTLIPDIAAQTAACYGVAARTRIFPRYEATINHAEPARAVRATWQQLFDSQAVASDFVAPVMASEDFSYYLDEIPGAFALIGGADAEKAHQAPLHSPHYDFNDALIPRVTQLFAQLAGAPQPR